MSEQPHLVAVYEQLCPVCGQQLSTAEINAHQCHTKNIPLNQPYHLEAFREFEAFFRERTGFQLTPVQRYWSKKLLLGLSFTALAPTGVGKTLLGIAYSGFLAQRGKRSYLMVPNSVLLEQVADRLQTCCPEVRLLAFRGRMKRAEKEAFFTALMQHDFDVLLTTTAFFSRHREKLVPLTMDHIFVDDVDAVLKTSRNVEWLLRLLGFSEEEVRSGQRHPETQVGQIWVSSATANPGRKSRLFTQLLNFSVGRMKQAIRNVVDIALPTVSPQPYDVLETILRQLPSGGLIFTTTEAEARQVAEQLVSQKISAAAVVSDLPAARRHSIIQQFQEGKIDFLVGVATPYGLLVRGIDMPLRILSAVFVGIPRRTVGVQDLEAISPQFLVHLAGLFRNHPEISRLLPYLRRKEEARQAVREIIRSFFERQDFSFLAPGVLVEENRLVIPDVSTYLQASGRTSRMWKGHLTRGAAIVLDTPARLTAFAERAMLYGIPFQTAQSPADVDWEHLRQELVNTRLQAELGALPQLEPVLFVVESPTKARQISQFFGKPGTFVINGQPFYEAVTDRFILVVTASLGHVADLVESRYFYGVEKTPGGFVPHLGSIKKCRQDNVQWIEAPACPRCGRPPDDDAAHRLHNFGFLGSLTENVLVATDPDAEGERIAWDVSNFTRFVARVQRAEFHEVTLDAIVQALRALREVNPWRVAAQFVRRISDRWVGFTLSGMLQHHFRDANLSAGRAQSPILGWIIEHFQGHRQKVAHVSARVDSVLIPLGTDREHAAVAELPEPFQLTIELQERTEVQRTPLPPYTTDALLQDIHRLLKIPAASAMHLLQFLFENGLITYHRTDSTAVSDRGMEIARLYLKDDFQGRRWATSEGAHECIRPTRPWDVATFRTMLFEGAYQTSGPVTRQHFRVYDLIFRRFMASQARPYAVTLARYRIDVPAISLQIDLEQAEAASGRAVELFPYVVQIKPALPEGSVRAERVIHRRPALPLLTQADVIRLMKERGIGRPSTYAVLIDRLFRRHYIIERGGKLIPTRRGMEVFHYLQQQVPQFISEEQTRQLEAWMDAVEQGSVDYQDILQQVYETVEPLAKALKPGPNSPEG